MFNSFTPFSAVECDLADVCAMASEVNPGVRSPFKWTDAQERYTLERLQGVRNTLWLTVGTSIDHRMTRVVCPKVFGNRKQDLLGKAGTVIDLCTFDPLNFTLAYTFTDGLGSTADALTFSARASHLADVQRLLSDAGYWAGPTFLTISGMEWDIKHWIDSGVPPEKYPFASATLGARLLINAAHKQWPRLKSVSVRNVYETHSPKSILGNSSVMRAFNSLIAAMEVPFASGQSRVQHQCSQSVLIANMAALMRQGGRREAGWSDGLHPASWVTVQYVNLMMNILSDVGVVCQG